MGGCYWIYRSLPPLAIPPSSLVKRVLVPKKGSMTLYRMLLTIDASEKWRALYLVTLPALYYRGTFCDELINRIIL